MQLGISSWAYPWSIGVNGYPKPTQPMTVFQLLEQTKELDATVLQIADNLPLDKMTSADLDALKRDSAGMGIAIEAGTRGIEPDWLLRYLDLSLAVGAKLLRTLTQTATSKPNGQQVVAWIEQALPRFEAAGVVIALENNEAHLPREYARFVQQIGSPSFGICLDTANSLGTPETTAVVVETLAPHALCLHYKEYGIARLDHRMGFHVVGREPGKGMVDAAWVVRKVAGHGRKANVILEQWPPYMGEIDSSVTMEKQWARQGVAVLKAALAGAK